MHRGNYQPSNTRMRRHLLSINQKPKRFGFTVETFVDNTLVFDSHRAIRLCPNALRTFELRPGRGKFACQRNTQFGGESLFHKGFYIILR